MKSQPQTKIMIQYYQTNKKQKKAENYLHEVLEVKPHNHHKNSFQNYNTLDIFGIHKDYKMNLSNKIHQEIFCIHEVHTTFLIQKQIKKLKLKKSKSSSVFF